MEEKPLQLCICSNRDGEAEEKLYKQQLGNGASEQKKSMQ